jgi:hypothetical protein
MKKTTRKPFLLISLMMLVVLACGISIDTGEKETQSEDPEIQQTVDALQMTQTAAAVPADDGGKTSDDKDADDDKDAGDETPCNKSRMVSETIADGTKFNGGESFTKSWTLRNAGTCKWTTDYKFVYESGDQMGGASSISMPSEIKLGETVTFKVDLKAPSADGDYTGVWRLKAADGEKLGQYWVKIIVGSGSAPAQQSANFAVTSVQLSTPDTAVDAPACPIEVPVSAKITTNGAGKVTYKWQDSTPAGSVLESIDFTEAGTKTVNYSVLVNLDDQIGVDIYIDDPNNQWFGPLEFTVTCP